MTTTGGRPQLRYLHDALEELKAKNQYFHLKVLEGEQKPVATRFPSIEDPKLVET